MPANDGKPFAEPSSPGQGTLSARVEACLKQLGNGFLRHPANDELRRLLVAASEDGTPTPERLFRQLIVVTYQLLILQVCEDRGLWPEVETRPRDLLENRDWFNDQDGLWRSLPYLWWLGYSPRVPSLWDLNRPDRPSTVVPRFVDEWLCAPPLGGCSISNRDLLEALRHIAWYGEGDDGPVDFAAIDIEELGTAYESLLELRPVIESATDATGRHELRLELVAGSQRKHSGSYYTPPELIEELIQSTLKPLVEKRLGPSRPLHESDRELSAKRAILSLRICDPACGTGHFLLAAARWLGKEMARIRTGVDEPDAQVVRQSVAEVVDHCIHGVDKDALAVKLCRIALWLEGQPNHRFLEHLNKRIRSGDALLGVLDLGVLAEGIPDQAFEAEDGKDRDFVRELKAANRLEREQSGGLPSRSSLTATGSSSSKVTVEQLRHACNLWTAAFFQPLRNGKPAITTAALADVLRGRAVDPELMEQATHAASQRHFFHWPLEFSEVIAKGGFDAVLGNPPWLSYTGRQKVSIAPSHLNFLTTRFPAIRRWPCAHTAFLLLARDLLRQDGRCGLVLPRQVADLDSFEAVRQSLATDLCLVGSVRDVGEDAFDGVTQPVALYCFARSGPGNSNWPIEQRPVGKKRNSLTSPAASLASLLDWCEKQPSFPARTFSDPGVHTGNVSQKIILNEPLEVPCGRLEPVREGKDLTAFHLAPPRKWVWIDAPLASDEYCRIGDGEHYRRVPILLRQTANRPIATRHNPPAYFRNSVLACHGLPRILDHVLVGFLNSSLYAFLHRARFKDPGQKAFPQVKIKHLHSLPQPPLAALLANRGELMLKIEALVAQIEQAAEHGVSYAAAAALLDTLVLRAFGLPEELAPLLRNQLA